MLRRTITARVRGPHHLAEAAVEDQRTLHTHGLLGQEKQTIRNSPLNEDLTPDKSCDQATVASRHSTQPSHLWDNDEMASVLPPSMPPEGNQPTETLLSEEIGLDLSAFLQGEDPLMDSGDWPFDFLHPHANSNKQAWTTV